ncbi:hypothetical protein CVN76_01115 [Bacillus sp. mrc49]|nr:hypothetical protein CVN76_16465 [Bacillus sp. mrc49]PJN92128.1 hypothetical protein CVN76_01115 [Bacillus sp. mrc49]
MFLVYLSLGSLLIFWKTGYATCQSHQTILKVIISILTLYAILRDNNHKSNPHDGGIIIVRIDVFKNNVKGGNFLFVSITSYLHKIYLKIFFCATYHIFESFLWKLSLTENLCFETKMHLII